MKKSTKVLSLLVLSLYIFLLFHLTISYQDSFQLFSHKVVTLIDQISFPYQKEFLFISSFTLLIITVLAFIFIIFIPIRRNAFTYPLKNGNLSIDVNVIEKYVMHQLKEKESLHFTNVKVKVTTRKIFVRVDGEMQEQNNIIATSGQLDEIIRKSILTLLGDEKRKVKVKIKLHAAKEKKKK